MKRILIILTGGTIASKTTGSGLTPDSHFEDKLKDVASNLLGFAQLEYLPLLNIDSTNIQPEHWLLMANAIRENYDTYDGFVLFLGTDTMAYTSSALSYLVQHPGKPIVLTGAQKPLAMPISDAARNIVDSVRFACYENMPGIYIVFSGQVILGTRAKKLKSKSYGAFSSINYPPVAVIEGETVYRYIQPQMTKEPLQWYARLSKDVFLLKLIPGLGPTILDYIGEHYRAVVLESYGVGGVPFLESNNFLDKLETLHNKGCIMVIATQVMLEGSDMDVYEVGHKVMEKYPVLQAYDMTIEAVVTKLMWALAQYESHEDIRKAFYKPVAHDLLLEV